MEQALNSYYLGIDIGSTRTTAAISRPGSDNGHVEVVNLGSGSFAVPTVLYLADDGSIVVGDAAERRALTRASRVLRDFTRRIGDPTPIVAGGRSGTPEMFTARLVRWVVDLVEQREGASAAGIAVTHPGSWGAHRCEILAGALAEEGIDARLVSEPNAAAARHAERLARGDALAVYDLGGTSFDVCVLAKDHNGGVGVPSRGTGGDHLGGAGFDDLVFEHVRIERPELFKSLDESDPATLTAIATLRKDCVAAKELLSDEPFVTIAVRLPTGHDSVSLSRAQFEAMITPSVERTVMVLRQTVDAAARSTPPTTVLLVGGSVKIPLVERLVTERSGLPVTLAADPASAVAQGAALSLLPVLPEKHVTSAAPPPPRPERASTVALAAAEAPSTRAPAGGARRVRPLLTAALALTVVILAGAAATVSGNLLSQPKPAFPPVEGHAATSAPPASSGSMTTRSRTPPTPKAGARPENGRPSQGAPVDRAELSPVATSSPQTAPVEPTPAATSPLATSPPVTSPPRPTTPPVATEPPTTAPSSLLDLGKLFG